MEEWRDIKDFPGYQISNIGRVRSFRVFKQGQHKGYDRIQDTSHMMKTESDDGNGYLKVMLRKNGKSYCRKIHRLVAEAFVHNPDPEEYNTVDHISNDKKDNRVENLRWVSRRENIQKAYKDRLCDERIRRSMRGVLIKNKYTGEEIDFESFGELAEFLDVDRSTISHAFDSGNTGELRDYYMWAEGRKRRRKK